MKHVCCPFCGSAETRYLFDTSDRNGWRGTSAGAVISCNSCRSGFVAEPKHSGLSPTLVGNDLVEGLNPSWVREADVHRIYWRRRLRSIETLTKQPGRLLDVGCYNGLFLDEARKAGWKCKGIEPEIEASGWAREKLGLDVITGTINDMPCDEPPFDVITMFHVVEHIPDALTTLKPLVHLLAEEGHLILETPDCGFWLNLLGTRFRYIQPDHLNYLSRLGITQMLQKAGFRVDSVKAVGKDTSVLNLNNWMAAYYPRWLSPRIPPSLARKTVYLNLHDIMFVDARRASET